VTVMYKIAVMGDRESVLGFRALGLETVIPDSPEEAGRSLTEMARQDYAIIYITESCAEEISDEVKKYSDSVKPAIILIPGKEGSRGTAMAALKDYVERAVGADII